MFWFEWSHMKWLTPETLYSSLRPSTPISGCMLMLEVVLLLRNNSDDMSFPWRTMLFIHCNQSSKYRSVASAKRPAAADGGWHCCDGWCQEHCDAKLLLLLDCSAPVPATRRSTHHSHHHHHHQYQHHRHLSAATHSLTRRHPPRRSPSLYKPQQTSYTNWKLARWFFHQFWFFYAFLFSHWSPTDRRTNWQDAQRTYYDGRMHNKLDIQVYTTRY